MKGPELFESQISELDLVLNDFPAVFVDRPVDFRKLNFITVAEPFYMPSTEAVIARLGAAKFLSKVDLAKSFHQIPMSECSKMFTAFCCKFGKFEYVRMPFGLCNAPATFQLLMQRCLDGLELFSSPYIDDIVVFSEDCPSHLTQRLQFHGLTVKLAKCL